MSGIHTRTVSRLLAALAVSALFTALPASPAAAGPADTDARPLVMLLVDTSGSMEYEAGATPPDTLPVCHHSRQGNVTYHKSRWAVLTEVLTGSFKNYWCQLHERPNQNLEEDSWWLEDHGKPRGVEENGSEQRLDGLLDIYRETLKFGLMTFDANPLTMTDASGGFSLGPDKGGTNLGGRNQNATFGALTVPPAADDLAGLQEANDRVQAQLLATRPYWTTPIAPLLDDAVHLFENDSRLRPWNATTSTGDPYSDCRTRAVVLLADGEPSVAYWSSFYPTTLAAAVTLYSKGIKVY
ncbi:MAG: hypothetical protein FJ098_08200, partial [Deltaproteobacteria bacterium]|nr:hypothetical protein [Deltaproteobacteria bacterium]